MQQNNGSDSQSPTQPSQEQNQRQQQPLQSHPQWVAMQYPTTAMLYDCKLDCQSNTTNEMSLNKKSSSYQQQYSLQGGYASNSASSQSDGDSSNTTIFVGGLDPNVTEEDLRQPFSQYGEIVSVKIPVGKGCGFVQFAGRNNAEEALQKLNGTIIGKQTVRLSWGRNPTNKQFRADYGNQWGGAYYGGAVYDGYGYAFPPPQNPGIYTAAYGVYPFYGSYQQQVN
ncbi:hypothetical protein GOBAR_DD28135 [Gossypium barbadense]|nr:hypothetical protein GOBAR_DD28135 [Gossypium barbadense]